MPRTEIYNQLASDKRFVQKGYITSDSLSPFYKGFFQGLCLDRGLVKTKADSIQIDLNSWKISHPGENGNFETTNKLLFTSTYYYSSSDSAEKEYKHIIDLLVKQNSDTSRAQKRYSESPLTREGILFKFHNQDSQIEIELYYFNQLHSELRLRFTRDE